MLGGKGMGGGSGSAGGNILRTVSKAVNGARVAGGGGLQEPFSSTTPTTSPSSPTSRAAHKQSSSNYHGLSSSSSSPFSAHNHAPLSATFGTPSWRLCNQCCDEFEWVSEDGNENEKAASGFSEDSMGWAVPSLDEVQSAVSALHRVFGPLSHSQLPLDDGYPEEDVPGRAVKPIGSVRRVSSSGSEVDWIEPSLELQLGDPRILQARGVGRVYDAFHLLDTDPSIQRMVLSVSSDRAVWDAILNNKAVQQLRKSFSEAKDDITQNSEESFSNKPSDESTNIVQWIFNSTKTRIMEVIERISDLINHLLQIGNNGGKKSTAGGMDLFEEKLRTSFLISIAVLLVVVVSRTYKASQ